MVAFAAVRTVEGGQVHRDERVAGQARQDVPAGVSMSQLVAPVAASRPTQLCAGPGRP